MSHKKGVLFGLIDRVLLLSHPRFYQDNFDLINVLLNNGYPLLFIFDGIDDKLKYHIHQCHETSKFRRDDLNKDNDHFFVLPYINITSNRFKFLTKKYHFNTAHT